jgi:hypothetical protein
MILTHSLLSPGYKFKNSYTLIYILAKLYDFQALKNLSKNTHTNKMIYSFEINIGKAFWIEKYWKNQIVYWILYSISLKGI